MKAQYFRQGFVDENPAAPPVLRAFVAVIAIAALMMAAIGWSIDCGPLRAAGVVLFAFFGLGTAAVQFSTLDTAGYLAAGLVGSLLALVLGSWTMLEVRWWHPGWAFLVVAVPAFTVHVIAVRRWSGRVEAHDAVVERILVGAGGPPTRVVGSGRGGTVPVRAPVNLRVSPSLVASAVGTVFWVSAALVCRHIVPGPGGFLVQIFPTWYLGPVCLLVALVTARRDREYEAAIAVTLLALCFAVTVEVVYDGLRSSSAARHIAVIQQLRVDRRLRPDLNIYNAWPGLFSMVAWITDVAGIGNPMVLARWWPALIGLFRLAELRYLAGKIIKPGYGCWVAALLALLADCLGADYFSPQSLGFILALAFYAMAVGHHQESVRRTRVRVAAMTAIGVALAVTHELSPYMAGVTVVVLVVFGVSRPRFTPTLVLGPAFVWAAINWHWVRTFVRLNDIGSPSNFSPPHQSGLDGLSRHPIIRITEFALLLGLVVLAVAAVAWFWRHRPRAVPWALGLCCLAPLVTVAVNAYGNEAIYRAILFAVPWMALMASAVYVRRRWLLAGAGLTLLATNMVGSYGMDAVDVMAPSDFAAMTYFDTYAPAGSFVMPTGGGDVPTAATAAYADHDVTSWTLLDPQSPQLVAAADASLSVAQMSIRLVRREDLRLAQAWFWVSPLNIEYDKLYALETPAQHRRFDVAVVHSGYWAPRYRAGGTVLLQLTAWPTVSWRGYAYVVMVAPGGSTVASVARAVYGRSTGAISTLDLYNPGFGSNPTKVVGYQPVIVPQTLAAPVLPDQLVS